MTGEPRLPRWARLALVVVAAALVIWLLFTVVFPRVDAMLDDPAMGAGVMVTPHDG